MDLGPGAAASDVVEAMLAVGDVVYELERFAPVVRRLGATGSAGDPTITALIGVAGLLEAQLRSAVVALDDTQRTLGPAGTL